MPPGDWRVRSVHSKEAGREDSAPKSYHRCDADAVSLAEGSIRTNHYARLFGVAGVPSPGHAFNWIPCEHRRAHYLSRQMGACAAQPQEHRVPGARGPLHGKRTTLSAEQPVVKGDRRRQLRVDEQSYEPMVPMKVENRRAPARGGHDIHWRDGANR